MNGEYFFFGFICQLEACDDGVSNKWYNEEIAQVNYYAEWLNSTPYPIDGD